MQGGERDLGGADEEELVLGDLVDHLALAREEAGPVQRRPRGRGPAARPGTKPCALGHLDGEADQRQLDEDEVARSGRRSASRRPPPPSRSRSGRAPGRSRGGRGPRSRTRAARRPRAARPRPRRCRRRARRDAGGLGSVAASRSRSDSTSASSPSSSLIRAETSRIAAIASSASRPSRLARPIASEASLRSARSPSTSGKQLTAAGVEAEQLVEVGVGADPGEGGACRRGVVADPLQVEQGRPRRSTVGVVVRRRGVAGLGVLLLLQGLVLVRRRPRRNRPPACRSSRR